MSNKTTSTSPMSLREFVSDTLSQIVSGVDYARSLNPKIAPTVSKREGSESYVAHRGSLGTPGAFIVDFDVAVTVSKKTDTDAKGGLSVHVIELGATRTSASEHSTVSRIKFQVPVVYEAL